MLGTQVSKPSIREGVTNHSLRRMFASLLYEAGASPAYVMEQMGHTSSALALEVYACKMARTRDTGARMDALIRGANWAQMGTNGDQATEAFAVEETKTAVGRRFGSERNETLRKPGAQSSERHLSRAPCMKTGADSAFATLARVFPPARC